jgi:valyl-tRNA synthetase
MSVFQRLFAPFLPFVCEEVWSWWQQGSIHRASWPGAAELDDELGGSGEIEREELALEIAAAALAEVRKAKSQAQLPMRAPVARVIVTDTAERIGALELGADDLRQAGSIELLETAEGEEFSVEVQLAAEG